MYKQGNRGFKEIEDYKKETLVHIPREISGGKKSTRLIETMAPRRKAVAKKTVANRHLVCCDCSCWIQFDTSGCTIPWAEMNRITVFKCKGCTEVSRLVGEVEDLRKMMDSLKRMVTGQGLEETSGETGIERQRWKKRRKGIIA